MDTLGGYLQTTFQGRIASKSGKISEVILFRELRLAMNELPHFPAAASELHGRAGWVNFPYPNGSSKPYRRAFPYATGAARCELGDLGLVAFSSSGEMRVVIVQNKFKSPGKPDEISIDFKQYNLLKGRPLFMFSPEVAGKYTGNPIDLIDASLQNSVCVYGNFYKTTLPDGSDSYDMSCITASELVRPLGRKRRHSRYKAILQDCDTKWQNAHSFKSGADFVAAKNLLDFGDLLGELRIGRDVGPANWKRMWEELSVAFSMKVEGGKAHTYGGGGYDDESYKKGSFESPKDALKACVMSFALSYTDTMVKPRSEASLRFLIRDACSLSDALEERFPFLERIPKWEELKEELEELKKEESFRRRIRERRYREFGGEPERFRYYAWGYFRRRLEDILDDMDDSSCGEYLAAYEERLNRRRGVWERFSRMCGVEVGGYDGRDGGGYGGRGGGSGGSGGSGDGGDGGDGYGRALLEGCRSVILLDVSEHPSAE